MGQRLLWRRSIKGVVGGHNCCGRCHPQKYQTIVNCKTKGPDCLLLLSGLLQHMLWSNLLERKGIIAKHELMEEIKQVNMQRLKAKP